MAFDLGGWRAYGEVGLRHTAHWPEHESVPNANSFDLDRIAWRLAVKINGSGSAMARQFGGGVFMLRVLCVVRGGMLNRSRREGEAWNGAVREPTGMRTPLPYHQESA